MTVWRIRAHGRVVDVRLSKSGGGLHVVAAYPNNSLSTRLFLGDDYLRAYWDEFRPPELRGVLVERVCMTRPDLVGGSRIDAPPPAVTGGAGDLKAARALYDPATGYPGPADRRVLRRR